MGSDKGREIWQQASAALGLWTLTLDSDASIVDVSDATAASMGLSPGSLRGMKLWDLVADTQEARQLRERFPLRGSGATPGFVLHMIGRDGRPRLLDWSPVLIDMDGELPHILLTGIDRTERPASGDFVRDDRDWYRRLLSQLPAVLWTTDRELNFTSGAGAGLARLGVREAELIGVPLERYFADKDSRIIGRHKCALSGDTVRYDTQWLGRNYQTVVAPLRRDPNGTPVGTIGLALDITDRIRAEQERDRSLAAERAARESAERALSARDEFLSIASHELYTPLTSLQLALQSVVGGDVDGPRAERLLELAERQTGRLLGLVQDLLDVSRIRAKRLELRRSPSDLAEIARDAGARFASSFAQASTRLSVVADAPVSGVWDGERLDQVVTNLLKNALRHARGGDVVLSVYREGGRAYIAVQDDGPGIPPELCENIFERFERAASSEHHGGLGLGLYIVRQIAEAHGGTATVVSEVGRGSRFLVALPVTHEANEEPPCDG